MADSEHLEILCQGIAKWNRWRKEEPGLVPDLSGASLAVSDLAGFDLRKCKLSGSFLRRADLGSALLSGADLTGVDLSYAYLGRAELYRRVMAGAAINAKPGTILSIEGVDLSEAIMVNANLTGAYIPRANFSHADLRHSRLLNTHFFGTDLRSAQLQDANLDGADLTAANLAGADFSRANLGAVNFWGANLKGADFTDAHLMYTILADVDLRDVKGLSSVHHEGHSTVGVDTLVRSGGMIPDTFLRACGLSAEFIERNRDLVLCARRSYSCFISYSHADDSFARRLYEQLQRRGVRCWLDKKNMRPGERILDSIEEAIGSHDKTILCCSKFSLSSGWVKDEIRKALERERQLGEERIIPLNLDGHLLDWKDGLASELRSRLAADFTNWEGDNAKFEEQFELVFRVLQPE
jgi:uncharacterized protein YjbI with pentapeptide repeats